MKTGTVAIAVIVCVGIPDVAYWPSCECFHASVFVDDIKTMTLDKLRSELLRRALAPLVALRSSIPELKDSDVHVKFVQLVPGGTKEIANFENGELILK